MTATNLRVVYDALSQPTGSFPAGINVATGTPVTIGPKQSTNLAVTFSADNSASTVGTIVLKVFDDERSNVAVGSVQIDYRLSDAKPALFPKPSFVESGVTQGGSTSEQVALEN